ncbi:MAG: hypothetical protein JSS76_06300 [Bacteroidetes bacterium]|nr:hypothetical protein [Bacteroidota bacterium]MBS1684344.1 hypothetical protein [Bacteroidota bacterium]
MKAYVSTFLLFTLLLNQTELHQLSRLPRLFSHYSQHRAIQPDLSVWSFLYMHYSTDRTHDNEDNNLPFKSDEAVFHFIPAFSTAPPAQNEVVLRLDTRSTPALEYDPSFTPTDAASLIWQPPKVS